MDEPAASSPLSEGLIEQERKRKRTRLLMAFGGVVVLGIGAFAGLTYADAQARDKVDGAFGALSRCLVGEPLAAGERASVRFRMIQLAAMAVPHDKRAKIGEQAWPQACGTHAHRLNETLRDAGRSKGDKGLASSAEKLAKFLQEDKGLTADLSEPIELVWSEAATDLVKARPAPDVALPPAPARALSADALKTVPPLSPKSFSLSTIHESPYPTATLRFVVDQKDIPNGPGLCSLAKGAASLTCKKLGPDVAAKSPGLRLWGTAEEEPAPIVFAGDRGSAGIYPSDTGQGLDALMTYGAYAGKDGKLSTLSWDEEEKKVKLSRAGAAKPELLWSTDDVGNPYYNVGVLWDQIVYKAVDRESGVLRLYGRPLAGGSKDAAEIGELAEPSRITPGEEYPHIAGCRTGDTTIARIRGSRNEQMAFRTGGKWLAPVLVSGLGGTLSCRGAEGTITRLAYGKEDARYAPTIHQSRCSAAGCRPGHVTMKDIVASVRDMYPQSEAHVAAADVDGKLLVVWSPGGAGGLRLKLGPIEEIAKAPDVVVYDDYLQEGGIKPLTTLFELRLLPRGDIAVLLLSTVSGVHALVIDAEGKITPTKVDWT